MSKVFFDSNNNVADTSKKAYKEISRDGTKTTQKEKVRLGLKAMGGEATINELSKEACADIEKSSISGRLNDLKDEGMVLDRPDNKRKDKYSNKKAKPWRLMVI